MTISNALLAQLFAQESDDPFLVLLTISPPSGSPFYLVNNTQPVVSRGMTFIPFPFKIRLPTDDGETARSFTVELDNVGLELIAPLRSFTQDIAVKLEMILASLPDDVQMVHEDLEIASISYNASTITANVISDNFLNSEFPGEKYQPTNFRGIF